MTDKTLDRQIGYAAQVSETEGEQAMPGIRASRQRDVNSARLLIAGDRVVDGKRYAIEGEALVFSTSVRPAVANRPVSGAILEQAREMLHQGFDRFAQDNGEQRHNGAHAGGAGSREQGYHGLLDCVIDDQAAVDPARYQAWIADNLGRGTQSRDGVRDRLILIVVGEMVEAETDKS
jgi:hypothetical protein